MAREPIPTWYFAVVNVRSENRFLLVQERKHGALWYLPAGRVEPGEQPTAAAQRETLEEAGIPAVLEGIVRIEHTPWAAGTARCRVIFVARPADDRLPRQVADEDTLGAAWVTLAELASLPLRHTEVVDLCEYIASGGPVYPLSVLSDEDAPYEFPGSVGG